MPESAQIFPTRSSGSNARQLVVDGTILRFVVPAERLIADPRDVVHCTLLSFPAGVAGSGSGIWRRWDCRPGCRHGVPREMESESVAHPGDVRIRGDCP